MALTETTIYRQINSETPMYAASGVDYLINGLSATYANKTDVYTKNEVYTKGEVDAKVTGVYHFKGSVGTFNDLLSAVQNPAVGDTYNVSDSGKNYAWTGSATAYEQGWDALGGIFDLEDYYTCEEIDEELAKYVKKEEGKGLSTNDYTTAEKTKLGGVEDGAQVNKIEKVKVDNVALTINPSDKSVNIDLSGKVDKVTGKGLSTNDYTTTEKNKLNGIESGAEVNVIDTIKVKDASGTTPLVPDGKAVTIDISGKVDKVEGKGLSTNDFTDDLETKLNGIAAGAQVNKIETVQVNGTTIAINNKTVNIPKGNGSVYGAVKISDVLPAASGDCSSDVAVSQVLLHQAATSLTNSINGKVSKVEGKDLSTNDFSNEYKTKLDGIATGAQVNVIETVKVDGTALAVDGKSVDIDLSGKVDKVSGKGLSTNDYTTAEKNKLNGIESGAQVNVNDFGVISDGTTTTSAGSTQDKFTIQGDGNVSVSLVGKTFTISGQSTDISGKADKTSFASLKNIEDMPTSNFNLDNLVTKFNAMAAILRNIGNALNPTNQA